MESWPKAVGDDAVVVVMQCFLVDSLLCAGFCSTILMVIENCSDSRIGQ